MISLEELKLEASSDEPDDDDSTEDSDLSEAFQLLWDTLKVFEIVLKGSRKGEQLSLKDHRKVADLAVEIEEFLDQWNWADAETPADKELANSFRD